MFLLFVSFLAGVLTVLAPCVLPLLPIIIGGSIQGQEKRNPYLITASLAIAVAVFTLILKFSTWFVDIPASVWNGVSGVVIIFFGLISFFPGWWEKLNVMLGLSQRSDQWLTGSAHVRNRWGDVLIGASLGPVFSSCSPTYFLILATVLPRQLAVGIVYLLVYAVGLSLALLLVSLLGRRLIRHLGFATDPRGWFKRGLGVLFIVTGVFILTGLDKTLQTYLVTHGYYTVSSLEQHLLEQVQTSGTTFQDAATEQNSSVATAMPKVVKNFPRYREFVRPSGFVNASPFTLSSLIGKKVILLDFMTYSCINCIRTFPYLNAWDEKYRAAGLEIVAIHTPEFAFEHKIDNVRAAMQKYGIQFPVVLDNDFGTWTAYGNSYWPRKYLIDIDGYVVYDHIGEGGYDETETKIQELLKEKMQRDQMNVSDVPTNLVQPVGLEPVEALSPETYFGASRNEYLGNGRQGLIGVQNLILPTRASLNSLNLGGQWNFQPEFATNQTQAATITYRYDAHNFYFVASADRPVKIRVLRDGKPLSSETAGPDISFEDGQSYLTVQAERLYHVIHDQAALSEHDVEFRIETPGLKAYTFTFG